MATPLSRRRPLSSLAAAILVSLPTVAAAQPTPPPSGAPDPQPAAAPPSSASPQEPLVPAEPPPADGPLADSVDPAKDSAKLAEQGKTRPTGDGLVGGRFSEIYSDDWWGHTRPVVELHGYFRTRGELFHNFALGRHNAPGQDPQNLWAHPLDHTYVDTSGTERAVNLCGDPDPRGQLANCQDKTQASGNLRLRLNPEIHISDNLRVMTQIDLLNNLVLGSTPDAYAMRPTARAASATGYQSAGSNANAPLSSMSQTQGPPTAGINGYRNSIEVQRAWAEYLTPLGQIRFGRMPHHWGMGMLYNSGDWFDADYQSNIDRIMFVSGVKSLDLYFGGAWDFVASGPTNATPYEIYGGQPNNTSNLSNVNQWAAFVARRTNADMQRHKLSRGDAVLNGGLYTLYRSNYIDVPAGETPLTTDTSTTNNGYERRGAKTLVPDLWVQFLWNKLRVEGELAFTYGSIENSPARATPTEPIPVRMAGLTTQTEFRAVEDKLKLQFGFGWASGDSNVEGLTPGAGAGGMQPRLGTGSMSAFQFHPAYYVDYIFYRRLLSRVQSSYYFRPSVDYDFVRNPNGQKFGGGAAIIWSRASEFVQTPGNKRDLGVELDVQLYYQAKDGALNDDPAKMGGFYTALQYGVFFPLGGLNYLPGEQTNKLSNWDTSSAQTVRLLLGVMF